LTQLRARKRGLNRTKFNMVKSANGNHTGNGLAGNGTTPDKVTLNEAQCAQFRAELAKTAVVRGWGPLDWELFLLRVEQDFTFGEFSTLRGLDDAYWRNRWLDKIEPAIKQAQERNFS